MNRHHPWLSWPQISSEPMQVACHFCDTLQTAPRLRDGDGAYCCSCGERLFRNRPRSLAHATGYSLAALFFMGISHAFPFLIMTSGNVTTRLTLVQSASELAQQNNPLLAAAVVFFTIIAPLILVGGLLYVAAPLRYGISLPGAIVAARWFQKMEPWSMLEVFLLGLVVSLLKLGKLADLEFGTGLWSLIGLVLCSAAAIGGIDRLELWDRLEISRLPPAEIPEPAPPPRA
ncbi:hypothetical protein FEM03_03300 [Phragmitibacter flavus]|uniref:Paraquat-inducible protein A n=1 Tax=Phragmitibacter flavus TaxID=2576071 RepID=A0A5R8KJ88_9BACT|nr:paraquat-inducible protein A [Phragmitibacter flavus]TLD72398.1 hypothetical protein FEM03_03300 [Phragmitibacter flavus]